MGKGGGAGWVKIASRGESPSEGAAKNMSLWNMPGI